MTPFDGPTNLLDALHAESCCRQLVVQSAALADAGDAHGLAALFSVDAELTRPNGQVLRGREAIENAYRERPPARMTAHLVACTLFAEVGQEAARAQTRILLWTGQSDSEAGPYGRDADPRQVMGRFEDVFVKTPQGWRIAIRRAVFDLHRS